MNSSATESALIHQGGDKRAGFRENETAVRKGRRKKTEEWMIRETHIRKSWLNLCAYKTARCWVLSWWQFHS